MRRNILEIYSAILNRAKNGALKWQLQTEAKMSYASFTMLLQNLLETDLLSTDESNLKICRNAEIRNVKYCTTTKGNQVLTKIIRLQEMMLS